MADFPLHHLDPFDQLLSAHALQRRIGVAGIEGGKADDGNTIGDRATDTSRDWRFAG